MGKFFMRQNPHFSITILFFILIWLTNCAIEPTPQPGATVVQPQGVETIQEETMPVNSIIPSPEDPHLSSQVKQAKDDLARRLSLAVDQITLLEVREVVWPDASLGCPQPGVAYEQVPQDGLLIRLDVEGRMYFYHSGGTKAPFLCEQTSQVIPEVTPKSDEFVPPPDWEID
jgi:hypothetical protein